MRTSNRLTLLFLSVAASIPAPAQTTGWTHIFGTSGYDYGLAVSATSSEIYVTGATYTQSNFFDIFVRKYDMQGNLLWGSLSGSNQTDFAEGISAAPDGVYVAGYTEGALPGQKLTGFTDAFIRKYDPDGNQLWTRQFGTTSQAEAYAVSTAADGVYIVGAVWGSLPNQPWIEADDVFIRKYDTNGNELWTREFGTDEEDYGYSVSTTADAVYVAGYTGGQLPGQTTNAGMFVRKYDINGNELWTREFGSVEVQKERVSATADAVYAVGAVAGPLNGQHYEGGQTDAFVLKFDSNGNQLWTREFGTQSVDQALGASATESGVYVAGYTGGTLPGQTSHGGSDAFIRLYDPNGNVLWTQQSGTPENDAFTGVSAFPGGVALSGWTSPGRGDTPAYAVVETYSELPRTAPPIST